MRGWLTGVELPQHGQTSREGDDRGFDAPGAEQEAFAAWFLGELKSDELFSRLRDLLAAMAEEARREYRAGLTDGAAGSRQVVKSRTTTAFSRICEVPLIPKVI